MTASDRREFQRLRLAKPVLGTLDSEEVLILDIGLGGALIEVEHHGPLEPGRRVTLRFLWQTREVEFEGEIARSDLIHDGESDSISHAGIRFLRPLGDSEFQLKDMIATVVGDILSAQRINASGERTDGDDPLSTLGGARRFRSRGYVSYQMDEEGNWLRCSTGSPEQPDRGFTVAQYEDEEELRLLCRAWEIGDEEARRLIRLVAEMSARSVAKT